MKDMTAGDQRPHLTAYRPRPADAPVALAGVVVVDFTRVIAGPFCTQFLADLGARVIKIENPAGGDDSRHINQSSLGGETAAYLAFNRGKQSVVLDLSSPGGRDIALELVKRADILVENFTSGVMERLGLGYGKVAATNPGLIYCSISAYGSTGAYAGRAGYDPVVQAESGLMSLNGFVDRPPVRMGPPMIDIATGIMGSNAILAALVAREKHGIGQQVEVSLFDNAVAMTSLFGMSYLMSGKSPQRFGQAPDAAAPVGLFEASDGPFYLCCVNDRLFRRLAVDALQRPDVAEDPQFITNPDRSRNKKELEAVLNAIFADRTCAEWVSLLQRANVPAGPVRSVAEAFSSVEMAEREIVSEVPHPTAGRVPNIAPAFRFSATPPVDPVAAPLLGQHTRQILAEFLGYENGQLDELGRAGAFGPDKAIGATRQE